MNEPRLRRHTERATMKRLTWALILVGITGAAYAENGSVIPDVVYGHKDGMALTFDVFKPESDANGAGVLFMVSGGWYSTWRPPEVFRPYFSALLDKGFTVFAIRHGSSPRYKVPEAYGDVKLAARFVHLHAKEYGVDPGRLGVYGGSAGGHLSLMLGTDSDEGDADAKEEVLRTSSRLAAVVAYFPPVDLRLLTGPNERFPALDFDRELAASVSPIVHVSSDDPPTLLIHGDEDELVPLITSQSIFKAFNEQGVTTELIVIEGAGHGFRKPDHQKEASDAMTAWFEKYLGDR